MAKDKEFEALLTELEDILSRVATMVDGVEDELDSWAERMEAFEASQADEDDEFDDSEDEDFMLEVERGERDMCEEVEEEVEPYDYDQDDDFNYDYEGGRD